MLVSQALQRSIRVKRLPPGIWAAASSTWASTAAPEDAAYLRSLLATKPHAPSQNLPSPPGGDAASQKELDEFYAALMQPPPAPDPTPDEALARSLPPQSPSVKGKIQAAAARRMVQLAERLKAHRQTLPNQGEASLSSALSSRRTALGGRHVQPSSVGVEGSGVGSTAEEDEARAAVLDQLEQHIALFDAPGGGAPSDTGAHFPIRLLDPQDWHKVASSAARSGRVADVQRVLQLAQQTGEDAQALAEAATLALVDVPVSERRIRREVLASQIRQVASSLGITEPSSSRNVELDAILHRPNTLPSQAYAQASAYLSTLEASPSSPPAASLYLQLFAFLSHTNSRRSLTLDLFDRMRLLAHPNPPPAAWVAVLKACAAGGTAEPERAMDTFLEMQSNGHAATPEAYGYLIRAFLRGRRRGLSGGRGKRRQDAEKGWGMALRVLGQMVGEGLKPDRQAFVALLEGAKRVGDLARAKWVYGLLLRDDAEAQAARAEGRQQGDLCNARKDERDWRVEGGVDMMALSFLLQTYASYQPPAESPVASASGLVPSPPHLGAGPAPIYDPAQDAAAAPVAAPSAAVASGDALGPGDPAFFARVPQTHEAVVGEATALLQTHLAHFSQFPQFYQRRSDQRRLALLHASYLSALSAHGTLPLLKASYDALTFDPAAPPAERQGRAPRLTWTYALLLERCEKSRDPEAAGGVGREAFAEWRRGEEWQRGFEQVGSAHARLASQVWAAWIRLQALFGGAHEALDTLRAFARRYPPTETRSDTPRLFFWHIELLYHRLKAEDASSQCRELSALVKSYESAWREGNENEAVARQRERQGLVTGRIATVVKGSGEQRPAPALAGQRSWGRGFGS